MKFTLAIEKKNRNNIGTVEGHNTRIHPTQSQLPEAAWITPQGHHSVIAFNPDLLATAKGLAKRKDAVLAVELVIGVGNQTDWRDMPTEDDPHGKRQPGTTKKLNALVAGVKAAAIAEFGRERIVSIDLHTDESTPHIHVVFVPISEGKLQAKKWLDGSVACAGLRQRLHAVVDQHISCDYTPGGPGGAPHNAAKAAGAVDAPRSVAKQQSMLEKASELLGKSAEIKALKTMISELNQQLQAVFSKLKRAEKRTEEALDLRRKADQKARDLRDVAAKQADEIKALELKVAELTPKPQPRPQFVPGAVLRPSPGPLQRPGKHPAP